MIATPKTNRSNDVDVSKKALANRTSRVAPIPLPSCTTKTGLAATILHARGVGLVIHKDVKCPRKNYCNLRVS